MEDQQVRGLSSYEIENLKKFKSLHLQFIPIDPSYDNHQGLSNKSFEDNLVDFFSSDLRRAGRTHLLARVFVHLAIIEQRTVYLIDHWKNVENPNPNIDNSIKDEVVKYINMLRDLGVLISFNIGRNNALDVNLSDYDAYERAKGIIINQQESFPNRVGIESKGLPFYKQVDKRHLYKYDKQGVKDLLNAYPLTPDECYKVNQEEILLIINKK